MSGLGYLGVAFGVTWLAIALYLLSIARRIRRVEDKVEKGKDDSRSRL